MGRPFLALAIAACFGCRAAGIQMQLLLDSLMEAPDVLLATLLPPQELMAEAHSDLGAVIIDTAVGPGKNNKTMLSAAGLLAEKKRTVKSDSQGKSQDQGKDSVAIESENEGMSETTRRKHKMTLGALATLIVCAASPVLFSQGLLPFAATLAYIVSLVAVKLCVKEIFKSGYPYPYATTAFHMLVTAIVASCIEKPNWGGGRGTLLVSVAKAASLALNNTALVFGTAAFVSILGSCTPATTYAVGICRYGTTTTSKTLAIMATVAGAMLCVKGEVAFSLFATILAVSACLCRSLKTVWSHDLLQVDMSPYRLCAWTAIWSFGMTAVAMLIMEGFAPFRAFPDTSLHTKVVFFAGAIMATVLNVVMCFVLKYLGPLQQNIFGQLELVAVLTLAMAWLHETVTTMQWMGVSLIAVGCLLSNFDTPSAVKRLFTRRRSLQSLSKAP